MTCNFVSKFLLIFLSVGTRVQALEGLADLEAKLFSQNQEYQSLQLQNEASQSLLGSTRSGYYPTLNAVGGYGQNKTDDLSVAEKGYLGYIEGRVNLFRGFKDQAAKNLRTNQINLVKNELETRKRDLRLQLVSVASDMILLHKFETILAEEYKTTQLQKQMAAKKVSAGLTSQVDKIEFELRESELLIEQKQFSQQHEEAHQKFNALLGSEVAESEFAKLDFSPSEKSALVVQNITVENTLEYKKAQLIQLQAEFEKSEIKSEFLPSVDFTFSAGRLTPSEMTPLQFNESKYALLLTVPLFSGFDTYYKTRAATQTLQAAERLKNQSRSDTYATIATAKAKMSELISLSQINEKRLLSSQKYFDLTLSEYKRGVKNSPDLVGATERLFSSRKKRYEILKDLELLKVRLETFN